MPIFDMYTVHDALGINFKVVILTLTIGIFSCYI